ncbi:MAG: GreA/GreB family elongation factor [Pseudohongiellaceae bacterium]
MSRYRPPPAPRSRYITAEGEQQLKAELHQLWKIERPRVTQSVAEAAALGDRSENAEYIYGKKRLREIDSRVRPDNLNKVYFGAWVTLEDDRGELVRYRLVGPDEIDPQRGYISIDSPLGKALLGKPSESDITITAPTGEAGYFIKSISYSDKPT